MNEDAGSMAPNPSDKLHVDIMHGRSLPEADLIVEDVLREVDPATDLGEVRQRHFEKAYERAYEELGGLIQGVIYSNEPSSYVERAYRMVGAPAFVEVTEEDKASLDGLLELARKESGPQYFAKHGLKHRQVVGKIATVLANEYRQRVQQVVYYDHLGELARQVTAPEDAVAITRAYMFIRANSVNPEGTNSNKYVNSYAKCLNIMLSAAGSLLSDASGTADPEEIAGMLEPAIEEFINNPSMVEAYSHANHNSGILVFMSQTLVKTANGTAEGIALAYQG